MGNKLYKEEHIIAIAVAIRNKLGSGAKFTVSQMASAIDSIKTGGLLQSKTATPSENAQSIKADPGYDGLSGVELNAVPSDYVGSAVSRKSSTDLSVSGAKVTAPAGYYANVAEKSIASGSVTVGTPTVNASGLVTASATVTEGYVSGDPSNKTLQLTTQAGKTVTPSESEQTAVASGRYTTGDVKVGAISSTYVGSGITRRSSSDLSASGATVSVPSGYYASQQTKSVTSGSAGTPSASKGSVSNHQISITPTVTNTTGYITGGTKTGTAVTVKASDLVSGSETKTSNGTYDVTNLAEIVVSVSGGGGSTKNVQAYIGTASVSSTSYTATAVRLTVAKTGTYKVSWMGWRSTNSGTSGSQLYINNSAYGSANTTFTNTYGHAVTLNNVSLTAGQEIVVRARARSTSYVMAVGNLIIEEV